MIHIVSIDTLVRVEADDTETAYRRAAYVYLARLQDYIAGRTDDTRPIELVTIDTEEAR